jgi:LemA protein
MSLNKVIAAIVVLVLLVGGVFFFTYNGLVSAEEDVHFQWSQVETQYMRRVDLYPILVETVKGYAAHEEKIFTEVAKYRSQWSAATTPEEKVEAANGMESAISRLLVVVEDYPQLKASENFLALQAQLEGTENRIAVARMRYNEAVMDYNTQLKRIPSSFVAGMLGLESKKYFEAEKGAQDVPKVNFNQPGTTTSPSASPSATTSPTITNASVNLYGDKTIVDEGESIVLKLSAVNLITKPVMTVQVILIPPSGLSVTSSEFVFSGSGQYTSTFQIEKGSSRNIEIIMQSVQTGNFIVEGTVIYYFGTDDANAEYQTLYLPITVNKKKPI